MNREIKFRGKLAHSGEWVKGNLIIANNGQPYIIPADLFTPDGHHLLIESDGAFCVIPKSVGEFTGFKDKNGTEIWECDIIKTAYGRYFTVEFKNCSWRVIPIPGLHSGLGNKLNIITTAEVIGNVFDNPELLTQNQ